MATSLSNDPAYVAALIAAKDCLHAVTNALEAALDAAPVSTMVDISPASECQAREDG